MAKKQQTEQNEKTVLESPDECQKLSDTCDLIIEKIKTRKQSKNA